MPFSNGPWQAPFSMRAPICRTDCFRLVCPMMQQTCLEVTTNSSELLHCPRMHIVTPSHANEHRFFCNTFKKECSKRAGNTTLPDSREFCFVASMTNAHSVGDSPKLSLCKIGIFLLPRHMSHKHTLLERHQLMTLEQTLPHTRMAGSHSLQMHCCMASPGLFLSVWNLYTCPLT